MSISLPTIVRLGRDICGRLDEAERREWWLTNGRGGYAAGTVAGSMTRRYHGLLVAPLQPPLGRFLLAAKADVTLEVDGEAWPLFANRWASGAVSPAGQVHIESFRLDGRMPVWRFALGDLLLEQRIWMPHGRDATHLAWRLLRTPRDADIRLHVDLLVSARDHHSQLETGALDPSIEAEGGLLRIRHPDWFDLNACAFGGTADASPQWVEQLHLPLERERGLSDSDNLLRAGTFHYELSPEVGSALALEVNRVPREAPETALHAFLDRERELLESAGRLVPELTEAPGWIRQLVLAADAFLFARPLPDEPDGESVIAGYPWFGDWGRDTMIALAGLTLATGRYASARRILRTFARFVDRGMLPNVFPGSGATPEYNSVDAGLWYIEAWRAYLETSGDYPSLAEVFPVLEEIVEQQRGGTRYGIGMDAADGLLCAGEPGVQLTWMDAKVGDWVVTPRMGKPVEINALWYNALRVMGAFARRLGKPPGEFEVLADRVESGFSRFIRPLGGLYDVLDGPDGDDGSVRPNQIFAVSLPHSPLDREAQQRVVDECGRYLLCSYGLRSLAPSAADYRGRYGGGVLERDGAYHQGSVWAWLLGHYALARYRVEGDPRAAQSLLEPLADHLSDAGVGTVSEIFDGDPPHTARGAPSQAWSVACTLEAWVRLERERWRQEHAKD